MPLKRLRITVEPGTAGRTLASLLHEAASLSHANARGLAARGMVSVDGRPVRDPAQRLREGQLVEASLDPEARYAAPRRRRGPGGLVLIHEDEDVIVVDKPAGLLTVPARGPGQDSLVARLLHLQAVRGRREPRLWAIHRIDRFTSGLVAFALNRPAAEVLIGQFAHRAPLREYLALCEGIPAPPQGRLESLLEEHPRSHKVRETRDGRRGRPASCTYVVEERLAGAALLRVRLETGRHNQIRAQLAGIGHPIVGDRTYGTGGALIGRTALHAARLGFVHPSTKRPVSFESPLPPDLAALLRRLRGRRRDREIDPPRTTS